MENASKALLMAAGILFVMLIVGLVVFAWGRFSDFYNNEDELQDIEDVAKFNQQFTGYQNRDDVHGYELISLANKVADYNFRRSNLQEAANDQKYTPIQMTIKFPQELIDDHKGVQDLIWYGSEQYSPHLFEDGRPYFQSSTQNQIKSIIETATGIENAYGDASTANKLAKSIDSLIITKKHVENYQYSHPNATDIEARKVLEKGAVDKYNSIAKKNLASDYQDMINNKLFDNKNGSIKQYYEYLQFKKGKFECKVITYDPGSDRVSTIEFKFTGAIE